MEESVLKKIGFIFLVILVLAVILEIVSNTIGNRQAYQGEAKDNVAASWTGSQEILGPVLRIPYTLEWQVERWGAEKQNRILVPQQQKKVIYLTSSTLHQNAQVTTDLKQKGIFKIPVFETNIGFSGEFDLSILNTIDTSHILSETINIKFGQATLGIGVKDARGISQSERLNWGDEQVDFRAGSLLNYLEQGLHAPVTLPGEHTRPIKFDFSFTLRGLDQLLFHPASTQYALNMSATWPHPSFVGSFLPNAHEITTDGFNANWSVTEFASNSRHLVMSCAEQECLMNSLTALGVKFIQPVDIYVQTQRSLKYALLFICLIFAAFFVFEILNALRIHPIQYGLIGLATSLFYVLLISLSEHIDFALAYLLASLACVGLIGFYLQSVLQSLTAAAVFSGWLFSIFLLLYVIVSAEDYALLMGSMTLFAMLALLMVATRKVDWYGIGLELKPSEQPEHK